MAILTKKEINQKLQEDLKIKNIFAIPKITKVTLNIGIGQTKTNQKFKDIAAETLQTISGQKASVRKAKKAIAGFKIRVGEEIGLTVTLRGKKMEDFLIKLANIVLPRLRDFRGLKNKAFDNQGNFSLGIGEHIIFPEISHDKAEILHGLLISITTTAKDKNEGRRLLELWGFPFEKAQGKPFEKEQNNG